MEADGGAAESEGHNKPDIVHKHKQHHHRQLFQLVSRFVILLGLILVMLPALYRSAYPFQVFNFTFSSVDKEEPHTLKGVLKKAATRDKTVIITTLNEAWATPNSIFDIFLESFKITNETKMLLEHLVVIALDPKAYERCMDLHLHCYFLRTNGEDFSGTAVYMSTEYLEMMWKRILFLRSVLELGYNFIFTDTDIMWFRNPFPHFYPDADFQVACDKFLGDPTNMENQPNAGFKYVKSNNHTIKFYEFWYNSRAANPQLNEQDVLNQIKTNPFLIEIGVKIKFLDTKYFGGFCQPSKDLNQVCTMHANCCFGLHKKIHDLKVMLADWRKFLNLPDNVKASQQTTWTGPQKCWAKDDDEPKKIQQGSNN